MRELIVSAMRARRCAQQWQPGTNIKQCEAAGCNRIPSFGRLGEARGRFCAEHRLPGMEDVKNKKCEAAGCKRVPSFNVVDEMRGRFCAEHQLAGMEDVKNKKCEAAGCKRTPSFNTPGETCGWFCAEHQLAGMEDVKNRKCEAAGCKRVPSFNLQRSRRDAWPVLRGAPAPGHGGRQEQEVRGRRVQAVAVLQQARYPRVVLLEASAAGHDPQPAGRRTPQQLKNDSATLQCFPTHRLRRDEAPAKVLRGRDVCSTGSLTPSRVICSKTAMSCTGISSKKISAAPPKVLRRVRYMVLNYSIDASFRDTFYVPKRGARIQMSSHRKHLCHDADAMVKYRKWLALQPPPRAAVVSSVPAVSAESQAALLAKLPPLVSPPSLRQKNREGPK
eukprot:scaffold3167_cov105-Isochrysis_galbana.AAC.3